MDERSRAVRILNHVNEHTYVTVAEVAAAFNSRNTKMIGHALSDLEALGHIRRIGAGVYGPVETRDE